MRRKLVLSMAGNVLVDSSFFISRIRRGEDPLVELSEFSDDHDFFTCGIVQTEVLRGLREKKAHARMAEFMECMAYVPTINRVWERIHQLAWSLDREGKIMQVTDLTIAVCALEVDAAVLSLDSDFLRIPGLRVIRELTN